MKQQYEESLKDQVEKKRREKDRESDDNRRFKETWNEKLSELKDREDHDDKFRKNLYLKNSEDLKRQMDEKQQRREEKLRQ